MMDPEQIASFIENGEVPRGTCPECNEELEYEKLDEFGPITIFEAECSCGLVANLEVELLGSDEHINT